MKTIALFGGSFDPPHIGHEAVVEALIQQKFLEKILVVPTFLNPFKRDSVAPASVRLKWLREIFINSKQVEVTPFEVNQGKKTPTITTVKHFLQYYDKIYLVIGADNLADLHKWYEFETLEKLVTFIVIPRDAITIPENYITLDVDIEVSSSDLRKKMKKDKLPKRVAQKIIDFYTQRKKMHNRIEKITAVLDANKAESIEVFDLREKNYFVDYAIIASSLGPKHTLALLDHLKKELKPAENFNNVDESGDWIVIDLGDILIHIMTPEYRVKYDMETFLSELGNNTTQEA